MPKILFGIVVAVIVLGWSFLGITTNVNIREAIALGTTTNTVTVLHSPLYTEDDKTTSQKAIFVNGTTHAKAIIF